jgi:Cd2+/Zn2+-exporting ATPase
VTHTHDHYHVSHHHKSGEVFGSFEHRAHYHSHEHNHAGLDHAHEGRDEDTERREHDETAHVHDHENPTGWGR